MDIALGILPDDPSAGTLQLAPLNVPLRVEIVQPLAAGAVAAACRGWMGEADDVEAVRVRVEVSPALTGTGAPAVQVDGPAMTIRGSGVLARAELDRGYADCAISAEYLGDSSALLRDILEPIVLMLLSRRDRTPLHASGFVIDGLAILLAGRSGAGKSCLARAADLAGLQVLSDDAVFVQLAPHLRIWGWPTATHLLAQDAPGETGPTRSRKGKAKQVVPLRSASPTAISCDRAALCFLSRGTEAALNRIPAARVGERLWPLDEGFDLLPGPIAAAVARLSAGGAWELRLSSDPADAVRLLKANLAWLKETAAV